MLYCCCYPTHYSTTTSIIAELHCSVLHHNFTGDKRHQLCHLLSTSKMNGQPSSNSQSTIRLLLYFSGSVSTISTSNATTKTINVPSSEVGGLQRAFDDILTLSGQYRNVRIFLENGTHRIANTVVVNSTHTANVDNIFVEAENAIVSGGVVVSSKWEKVKVIKKKKKAVVWKANLPQNVDLSISSRLQAWRGKKRLQVARSPLYCTQTLPPKLVMHQVKYWKNTMIRKTYGSFVRKLDGFFASNSEHKRLHKKPFKHRLMHCGQIKRQAPLLHNEC